MTAFRDKWLLQQKKLNSSLKTCLKKAEAKAKKQAAKEKIT